MKSFKLLAKDGHEWILTKNVHGKFRPFSISIIEKSKGKGQANRECEASGLGIHGHHVRIDEELEEISLLVAASSYLLYSTA